LTDIIYLFIHLFITYLFIKSYTLVLD